MAVAAITAAGASNSNPSPTSTPEKAPDPRQKVRGQSVASARQLNGGGVAAAVAAVPAAAVPNPSAELPKAGARVRLIDAQPVRARAPPGTQ